MTAWRKPSLRRRLKRHYNTNCVTSCRGNTFSFSVYLTKEIGAKTGDIWTLEYDDRTHIIRMMPATQEDIEKRYVVRLTTKGRNNGLARAGFTDTDLFDKLFISRRTFISLATIGEYRDGRKTVEFGYRERIHSYNGTVGEAKERVIRKRTYNFNRAIKAKHEQS